MEALEVDERPQVMVAGPNWRQRASARLRQMSNAERNYFYATCVLSILTAGAIAALVLLYIFGTGQYCVSKECVRSAAQILNSMNASADPCTDFYEFACGGWKNIGGDEEDNWSLRLLKDTTRRAVDLLAHNSTATDFEAVKKARSLYRECMSTSVLDKLGLEPMLELLERAGLPRGIPNRKTAMDFDLSRAIAKIHRALGKPVLIDVLRESSETFTVWMPPLDITDTPNMAVLEAFDSWLTLEAQNRTDLAQNDTDKVDWHNFARNMSSLVDGIHELDRRRFSESVSFQDEMKFVPPRMKRMKLPASRVTALLYNGTVPNNITTTLYYEVYMETLLEGRDDVNWTVNKGTLRIADPEYHSFLVSALKNFSPLNIQMLVWTEVVKHFGVHTTTKLRQRMKNRQSAMKSQSPRSEACSELVINLMPVAIDYLTAREDPMIEVTEKVTAMTREIQKSQRELVLASKWIGLWGEENILRHLDDVKVARVGYLDWVLEGRGIDEFFKDVVIHKERLLRTIADIQVWQAETNFHLSPTVGRLRTDHVLASAYYYRSMNTITVRPMIMRFPFYPLGLDALNYGAMGLVLGHEFGHALDAEAFSGSEYFYMEKEAVERVEDFVNCTKRRIGEFSAKLKVGATPDQSINEDVSDISALKTALYTFNRIRRGSGRELHLPGLERFNHDQLFFLAFGNVWCSNGKPPGPDAEDGPHNANRMRILSAASNTAEFATIWNCPPEAPMNPKKKCILW